MRCKNNTIAIGRRLRTLRKTETALARDERRYACGLNMKKSADRERANVRGRWQTFLSGASTPVLRARAKSIRQINRL